MFGGLGFITIKEKITKAISNTVQRNTTNEVIQKLSKEGSRYFHFQ